MTAPKHTPGPWTLEPRETKEGTRYQHICSGPIGVADTYHCDPIVVEGWGPLTGSTRARHGNPADAYRIVAAVNACEGIPTEALEQGVVKEAVDVLASISDYYEGESAPPFIRDVHDALAKARGR